MSCIAEQKELVRASYAKQIRQAFKEVWALKKPADNKSWVVIILEVLMTLQALLCTSPCKSCNIKFSISNFKQQDRKLFAFVV